MGIRGRLIALSIGVALPLMLVGLVGLWGIWTANRRQFDYSVEQQAQLAAVAFERWIDAQQEPLAVVAAYAAKQRVRPTALRENLNLIVVTRPHWIDLRILDETGNTVVAHSSDPESLPAGLADNLFTEMRHRSPAVVADWSQGATHPLLTIAEPIEGGGAVIARVDAAAMSAIFRHIKLPDQAVIALVDPQNRVLYHSLTRQTYVGNDVSGSPLLTVVSDRRTAVIEGESPFDGMRRLHGLARVAGTDFVVMVGVPSATLYKPERRQLIRYALFSLLALLCAVAAALIIARGILRPIRRLRETAQLLGAGDLSARAPATDVGEIAEFGAAFNAMAVRIEEREARLAELDRLKSEFVSGVSHELRTPLTTIKTLTRVMLRDSLSEAERQGYLETISAECNRQIDLVLNLLDLSRIEAGLLYLALERVDVAEVVRACLVIERHAAETHGHILCADLPEELPPVLADRAALRRVLCSLVENAIKYTPDGGRILIVANAVDDEVAISITDNGRGIAPEDLPRVFEKFYRGRSNVTSAHNRTAGLSVDHAEVPGVGLGLYLARNIIEQLNGKISVESAVGFGTTFTVYLPLWCDKKDGDEIAKEDQYV